MKNISIKRIRQIMDTAKEASCTSFAIDLEGFKLSFSFSAGINYLPVEREVLPVGYDPITNPDQIIFEEAAKQQKADAEYLDQLLASSTP